MGQAGSVAYQGFERRASGGHRSVLKAAGRSSEFDDEISAAREYDRAVRRLKLNRPVNLPASSEDSDDGPAAPVVSTCGSEDDGDSVWECDDDDVVEDEDEDDGDDDDDDSDVDDEDGLQQTESSLEPPLKRTRIDDPAAVAHKCSSTATVPVPATHDALKQLQEVVTAAMVQTRNKDQVERQRVAEAFAVIFKRHLQTEIREFAERTITNSFAPMDVRRKEDRELLLQMFIAAFIASL